MTALTSRITQVVLKVAGYFGVTVTASQAGEIAGWAVAGAALAIDMFIHSKIKAKT